MATPSPLLRESVGPCEVWTVARPAARNAIDRAVLDGLERAVREAEQNRALRAVVLTGQGERVFVSGADLKDLRAMPAAERRAFDARMRQTLSRMRALPVPVLAALNGLVLGGGAELALCCDIRIAEPHTSVAFKHAAMGVTPGWGGLAELLSVVSQATAARLLFSALPMDAPELLRVGLVDELVGPGESRERALALGDAIAETSASAVAHMKRLLRGAFHPFDAATRDEERRTFEELAESPDHLEAVAAFAEKRRPRFGPRGG